MRRYSVREGEAKELLVFFFITEGITATRRFKAKSESVDSGGDSYWYLKSVP